MAPIPRVLFGEQGPDLTLHNQWDVTNNRPETNFSAQCVGDSAWAFSAPRMGLRAKYLEGDLHGHWERKVRALERERDGPLKRFRDIPMRIEQQRNCLPMKPLPPTRARV